MRRRRRYALAGRIAAVLLLVVASWLGRGADPARDTRLAVLIDDTATATAELPVPGLLTRAGDRATVQRGIPVAELPAAIERYLWQTPAAAPIVVVASDGRWPSAMRTLATELHKAGRPLVWLPAPAPPARTRIRRVSAPLLAPPGSDIGVAVSFSLATTSPVDVVLLADEREIDSVRAEGSGEVGFAVRAPVRGAVVYGAALRAADSGELLDRVDDGAALNTLDTPDLWVIAAGRSVIADSLRRGGWRVTEVRPGAVSARLDGLAGADAVILDDVAIADLSASAWTLLVERVRRNAMGLIVLGGANSFGLGGYRDSLLETILPVVSEPPADHQPVSLLFLVDVSGSMDRDALAGSRLAMARQAVIETAHSLRPADRVGLMSFSVTSEVVLPLDSRADHATAIARAWPMRAAGGTAMSSPLRQALESLAGDPAEQKFLVVLTDGRLADQDLIETTPLLAATDAQVIALVMAAEAGAPDPPLFQLLEDNGGVGIRVDDVLRLPELARAEVEARRPASVNAAGRLRVDLPLPWLADERDWPGVARYALTRPRSGATVYLSSARGDPLIAGSDAGAGRVIAVMPGTSTWAGDWLTWERWPRFVAGLAGFVAAGAAGSARITLDDDGFGAAAVTVDLANRRYAADLAMRLSGADGRLSAPGLQPVAPGLYAAPLDGAGGDRFTAVLQSPTGVHRQTVVRGYSPGNVGTRASLAATLASEGLLTVAEGSLPGTAPAHDRLMRMLVGAALAAFLFALIVERQIPGWPAALRGGRAGMHARKR